MKPVYHAAGRSRATMFQRHGDARKLGGSLHESSGMTKVVSTLAARLAGTPDIALNIGPLLSRTLSGIESQH